MTSLLAVGTYPMAPALDVDEWINGDEVTLDDLKGKVVVIDFSRCGVRGAITSRSVCGPLGTAICQGNYRRPTRHVEHTYVFKGHDHQRTERLKPYLRKKGINHRVGVDRHQGKDPIPQTMKPFRTRGTPEMAILDKQGCIRFQHFGGFRIKLA